MKKQLQHSRGYTLIELLTYIAIFIALSVLLLQSLVTAVRIYAASQGTRSIASSADLALDRITREIRNATSISSESVFDTASGKLVLSGTSDDGSVHSVTFAAENGALKITDNGTTSLLTSEGIQVSEFGVSHISNGGSNGARIVLTLETVRGQSQHATFYASALTRGK